MAEFDSFSSPTDGEAVLYEFRPRSYFGSVVPYNERDAFELYEDSGVAWWAGERAGKYGEVVTPQFMYIVPDDFHHVLWVKHSGVRENRQDQLVPYAMHHAVCDCAAELHTSWGEDEKTDGLPLSSLTCEHIQVVLVQRAAELATEHGIYDALGAYTTFDGNEQDFRLTDLGQELTARAIAGLLEIDKLHPETWVANRINGLHEVELLAAYIGYGTEEVMASLEMLEQGDIVSVTGDEVKLSPRLAA